MPQGEIGNGCSIHGHQLGAIPCPRPNALSDRTSTRARSPIGTKLPIQNAPFNYPNLRLARVALPYRGTLKASLAIVRQSSWKSFSIGRPLHK